MKNKAIYLLLVTFTLASCTSQEQLSYLKNLPETGGEDRFVMEIPDYKLQPRDVLYVTIMAMTPDGSIKDFLSSGVGNQISSIGQSEGGGYIAGYSINLDGDIILPVIGTIKVKDLTIEQARKLLQSYAENVFNNATVECKLLSFKFTVIGEVKTPGSYINYNNHLTVLEAIGRAGGINDYGRRDKVLVVRQNQKENLTYVLNLQDKKILSSKAYFLLPNDVVIVEPEKQKIFNMNLPTISFIITTITSTLTTTLLLINYFK